MVDGGGGLHGDGDGDGGGGHTVTVARSDDLMSPLVTGLVVCGCHRVYCSLGASGRCRGDMVRSTNTPKTPGGDVKV